jgi:integrase
VRADGKPVNKLRRSWAAARERAELGTDVTPHILRHTAATWLMQAGVSLWEAAGYLGMTVEVLERVYGHHHPEHMNKRERRFRRTVSEQFQANRK